MVHEYPGILGTNKNSCENVRMLLGCFFHISYRISNPLEYLEDIRSSQTIGQLHKQIKLIWFFGSFYGKPSSKSLKALSCKDFNDNNEHNSLQPLPRKGFDRINRQPP